MNGADLLRNHMDIDTYAGEIPQKELSLRPYQEKAVNALRSVMAQGIRRVILSSPTGSGKCLGVGTMVLMHDGTTRPVQDVRPSDKLMGPDGKPRNVISTASGKDQLYTIIPTKGDPYTVNSVHLLSLRPTPRGCGMNLPNGVYVRKYTTDPVFIEAKDFYSSNKTVKHCLKGWRPDAVSFANEKGDLPIDPYILGIWLGDGTASQPSISKPKGAVSDAFVDYAELNGCDVSHSKYGDRCDYFRITNRNRRGDDGKLLRSKFHNLLEDMGLLRNKYIPNDYIMTTTHNRLELLAGLLDTDGYMVNGGFDFIQKSEQIAKAVVFICRSLGLAAYAKRVMKGITSTGFRDWYWRVSISGDCSIIPNRDENKKAPIRKQKKNHLVTGIRIEEAGYGDYYGFEIDGDKQFLLADWQVTHNTEMGFAIIRGAQAKGKKVAFLANRIHLVNQTCRRLSEAGFSYGVIQGDNTSQPWRSILVCSIDSVASRGLPDVDLLVIDEAHACAGTKAYREIMAGKPVIGLTATPYSKGLGKAYPELGGALFERVVIAARIEDLISEGYLVSADVWAPSEPDLDSVSVVSGEYNSTELGHAVDKPLLIGDIVRHWFIHAQNTPTVVFATNIIHSKHIVDEFLASGVQAEHLDCYTPDGERAEILARVASGETMVISNVGILAEGWDFPACKTLILARPTKSLIRYLQMAGRVLRPYPGKDRALILDHSGVVRRLGFPWDYFGQRLDDGKPKKVEAQEQPEPLPKPCHQCHFMKPPKTPICPNCGFKATKPCDIDILDEDLVQLTKTGKPKAQQTLQDMSRPAIYGQLCRIARDRGKSESWVKANYKEIFGTWPRQEYHLEAPTDELVSWLKHKAIQWHKGKGKQS